MKVFVEFSNVAVMVDQQFLTAYESLVDCQRWSAEVCALRAMSSLQSNNNKKRSKFTQTAPLLCICVGWFKVVPS